MTMQFVTDYIEKKLEENIEFIRYTFYELRVKNNLSQEDIDEFLDINKDYFENKNYKVYFTGDIYIYKNETKQVTENELMVIIRQ